LGEIENARKNTARGSDMPKIEFPDGTVNNVYDLIPEEERRLARYVNLAPAKTFGYKPIFESDVVS
jgi:hypothetical protein